MTDQAHRVALTVPDESHPLIGAGRTKPVIAVAEDNVGCRDHLHSPALKGADGCSDIRNFKIEQRRRRSGLKEQPDAVDVKKQQARRVKDRSWFRTQQVRVERRCALEICGPLGSLDQPHFFSLCKPSITLRQPSSTFRQRAARFRRVVSTVNAISSKP